LGFSVTMSGVIVLAVVFIAVATSVSVIMKTYTTSIRSLEQIIYKNVELERATIYIKNAYINATEGNLYVELQNAGSLDLWNLPSTDFLIIYWDSSLNSTKGELLSYGTNWTVKGIMTSNGSLYGYSGYVPPGQTALIVAYLPSNVDYSKDIRIDITNSYGFVTTYEIIGGG